MMPGSASKSIKKQRWKRRKNARPGEILDAALTLFVERGFAATRLDDVARKAGISKGTLYLYFKNKEVLFRAMVQEMVLPEVEQLEQQVAHYRGPIQELVRKLVHQWWHAVGETRLSGIPKLLVSEAGNFPELARFFVDQVIRRGRRIFIRVLQQGIDRGEFRECDVNHAARVLIAPLVFAAIWQHSLYPFDKDPYDVHVFLDTHLDTFLKGLLTESG